jgi:GxxExxY protein
MEKKQYDFLSGQIIDSAFQVHKAFGPGLLESLYQCCLHEELRQRNIGIRQEVFLPLFYKGIPLYKDFRIDLLVEEEIIIEIKSIDAIAPIHEAQLLSYLRLSNKWLGLLINFNVPVIKSGIRRMVNGYL